MFKESLPPLPSPGLPKGASDMHLRGPTPRNQFPTEAVTPGQYPSPWLWGVFSLSEEGVTPKVKVFCVWTFSMGKWGCANPVVSKPFRFMTGHSRDFS